MGRVRNVNYPFFIISYQGIIQAAPVQNQWYTVFNLSHVYLYAFRFQIGVAAETIEIEMTINGVLWPTFSIAAAAGTDYAICLSQATVTATNFVVGGAWAYESLSRVGHGLGFASIQIRMRKTTNNGAGNLRASSWIHKIPPGHAIFRLQPAAILDQAAPVQNQWYPVLNTTINADLISCKVGITVAGETLECRWTVDGTIIPSNSMACVAGTIYFVTLYPGTANQFLDIGTGGGGIPAGSGTAGGSAKSRSIKIELRKTTNAGAGHLQAGVWYGKL